MAIAAVLVEDIAADVAVTDVEVATAEEVAAEVDVVDNAAADVLESAIASATWIASSTTI